MARYWRLLDYRKNGKTLYGWWLLEEGTSRNVPIAGFEMILREDYKSRDEVEGLIIFPKYHFKPQDTWNIPWSSRQQSRHLLYCMAPHCLAQLSLSIFLLAQRGFSLKLRAGAMRVYCIMRAKTASARSRAVNIHVWSDSIASSFCHLFAWKEWKHFVVSINVPPPQLWEGNILKCLSITWLCLANRWLALD